MPRWLFRFTVLAGTCLAALFVLPLIVGLFQRPSALYLHIESLPWRSVTIESTNFSEPRSFTPGAGELRVSPISHGIYRIGIQLSDGQTVWAQFFHYDTGVRRRIDVFVAASPQPGQVRFRETANQKEQLFEGDARPGEATPEKPLVLDWI